MKNLVKFILFIIYTLFIFLIKSYEIIIAIVAINLGIMAILKINIVKSMQNLYKVLWFIIFTIIINILFSSLNEGILIGIRLILVCNITYSFSTIFTYIELAEVVEKICTPLKIFKIDTKQIGLIICIAIAFIPTLQSEIGQIQLSLKSKGNTKGLLRSIIYIFQPFLVNLFKKVNQIEEALQSKGWKEGI